MKKETIYCRFCGEPGIVVQKSKIQRDYCKSCRGRHTKEKREQTMLEKYGVSNPSKLPSHKKVMDRVNVKRKEMFASGELVPHFKGQTKETNPTLKRVAEELSKKRRKQFASEELQPWNKGLTKEDSESIRRVGEAVSKRKRGKEPTEKEYEHILNLAKLNRGEEHSEERIEKTKATNFERYGVESYLSLVYEKGLEAIQEKYGGAFPGSEEFRKQEDRIFQKMKETNKEKYGFEYAVQNKKVLQKVFDTKRANGSFKSSKVEKKAVKLLKEKRKEVWTQYKTKEYPFRCDIYLPKDDLYIELNFHWTHNSHPFDSSNLEDIKVLKEWTEKAKESDFYKKAIEVWTIRDVEKKLTFESKNLNHKIFYSFEEFEKFYEVLEKEEMGFMNRTLEYSFDSAKITSEFKKLLRNNLSYNTNKKNNNLILPFVWEIFYRQELSKWKDQNIRKRLIQNRCTYLHKLEKDLTDNELLSGFSKSLIHKGYSSFSPFVIKSFIQDYSIKSIYDPCGGWGHRMLGAWDIKYHYNDFNSELVDKIKKMHRFYSETSAGGEKTFSCEDASTHTPEERFDAVFTCPPYFNTEDYLFEGDSSSVFPEYDNWLNIWWRNVVKRGKQVSDIFAYVVSNKYSKDMNRILEEERFKLESRKLISSGRPNHMNTSAVEYLYVFQTN